MNHTTVKKTGATSALTVALLTLFATAARAADVVTVVDAAASVSSEPSLALDAVGNPVIAYWDVGPGDLRVVHCDDPNCEGSETPSIVDTAGNAGANPSLRLDAAGNPVIAYGVIAAPWAIRLVHCNDPACAGGDETPSVLFAGNVARLPSLVLDAAGNPVVSYFEDVTDEVRVVHCNDPACTGGDDVGIVVDVTDGFDNVSSIELDASGNPIVLYRGDDGVGLMLLHCNDPLCAGGDDVATMLDNVFVSLRPDMTLDPAGLPAIAWIRGDVLHVVRCADVACSSRTQTPVFAARGAQPSITIDAAGNPAVIYRGFNSSTAQAAVLHCDDPLCVSETVSVVDEDTGFFGGSGSIAIDAAGNPVVAYADDNDDDLMLAHCDDPRCEAPPSDRDGDGVPDASDAFPDDPAEWADADADGVGDNGDPDTTADAVAALPDDTFRAHGQRTAIRSRLADAETAIDEGRTEDARRILTNLRRRLDGCELAPVADLDDWIVDCTAQNEIRTLLDTLIASL